MKELLHRYAIWVALAMAYAVAISAFAFALPGPAVAADEPENVAEYSVFYYQQSPEYRASMDAAFWKLWARDLKVQRADLPATSPNGSMTTTAADWNKASITLVIHTKLHVPIPDLTEDRTKAMGLYLDSITCEYRLYELFTNLYGGTVVYTYYRMDGSVLISHPVTVISCIGGT